MIRFLCFKTVRVTEIYGQIVEIYGESIMTEENVVSDIYGS